MTIEISGSVPADDKVRRYVDKILGSIEKYIPKSDRDATRAKVDLNRVNRAHNNKYEATITLDVSGRVITIQDSTMNVFAALDIVRLKLVRELEK